MSKEQIMFLIGKSQVPMSYVSDLRAIFDKDAREGAMWLMMEAFIYGIIIGKQQDRARRKKSGVNA